MKKASLFFTISILFFALFFLSSCNTLEYIQTPEDAVNTVYTLTVIGAVALAYFKFK